MSVSPMTTVPALTRTTPTRLLRKVDLPEPFAPTRETTSPGSARTVMFLMTGSPPYPAVTPVARSGTPPEVRSADKVGLHDIAPAPQLGHGALSEHGPLGHGHHRVTELVHDRQLVLDHEHGQPPGGERDELAPDPAGQARVDPGHRLIEQQHLRLGHQRAHDLDHAALAAAEVSRVAAGLG